MHLDTLLFILLIAVAILFQLLTRVASKTRQAGENPENEMRGSTSAPRTRPLISRAPVESDEQRIRKFLEALGQPPSSRPPPPVVPRTDIPPRPVAPVRPPPIPTARNVLTRKKRQIVQAPKTPALASIFEVHEAPPPLKPADSVRSPVEASMMAIGPKAKLAENVTNIATLLRSTTGLRNAIILREIFGPPRSLQPFDLIGA